MVVKKLDNHYTRDKVQLRLDHLPDLPTVRVLDVYGGHGVIWSAVKKMTDKNIERLAIDQRQDLKAAHLHGDSERILPQLRLSDYDVIDLDAYGVPYLQLQEVFRQNFQGVVFVTFIQKMQGVLQKKMLKELGFSEKMYEKAPTLLAKRGFSLFLQYLAQNGVTKVRHRSANRKHYLVFNCAAQYEAGSRSRAVEISASPA